MDLRDALKGKLNDQEMGMLKTAFDVVGDIAIIEIDESLRKKEKIIAETLLSLLKNIRVVARKDSGHEGEFRLQKLEVLAGEDRKETEYRENGCRFRLNVEEVYFSPRLSTERKRIALLVREPEDILVMFSGAGPYPIVLSKMTPARNIVAVEKNPDGNKWALENAKLNKCNNIIFHCGDAGVVVPRLGKVFDRVLMPLPRGGEHFLPVALGAAKAGAMVHFYDFLHENEFPQAKEKVRSACRSAGRRFRTSLFRPCGQSGPRFYRVCLDFRVW